MSTYRQANAYKAAAVTTATPGSLLLMLYDGAIKFMNIAERAFDEEDPLTYNQTIHNNLIKAQNIVRELRSALIGGDDDEERIELVNNLIALYDYFDRRLQEANVKKDREIVKEVIARMSELRGAWDESFEKEKLDQATQGKPVTGTQKPAGDESSRLSLMG